MPIIEKIMEGVEYRDVRMHRAAISNRGQQRYPSTFFLCGKGVINLARRYRLAWVDFSSFQYGFGCKRPEGTGAAGIVRVTMIITAVPLVFLRLGIRLRSSTSSEARIRS
jgi:hypothetical protein